MTAAVVAVAAVLGLVAGAAVNRIAGAFPWDDQAPRAATAVRPPLLEVGTAVLFGLTAWRFGLAEDLPAYLALAAVGVLLAAVDLRHRLLPNRVIGPALAAGAVLLAGAAGLDSRWEDLRRAVLAALVLYAVFLVLALISPRSLGMGDVKLAALLGLHLGWLSWDAALLGAAAGFVVQAAVSLVLLASRRIGLRGELPFGPAMLGGAALAIGASGFAPF